MIRKLALFFCTFLLTATTLRSSEESIVFIHIGKEFPEYLQTSVKQARLFNQDTDIYVVGNYRALRRKKSFFSGLDVKTITCESLIMSDQHQQFLKKSKIDSSFREGFWKYAIERFFYLDELMDQQNLSHVYHLESDVMLYTSVNQLTPIMKKYYTGIGATFDNDERCIAGLIYFSGKKASWDFADYMVKTATKNYNDMDTLSHYRKESSPKKIDHLPIVMDKYDGNLRSLSGKYPANQMLFSNHFEDFDSLFDAAALGQFLGGEDPRNGSRGPGFINESCVFNPSKFQFIWIKDEKGRNVPYVNYKGKKIRINNLHIHSKNLKEFQSWGS